MSNFKIISIDGGGCRGTIPVTYLDRLLQAHPNLLKDVNLIAGTSIGGIIALLLAAGDSPNSIQNLLLEKSKMIFNKEIIRQAQGGLIEAKYSNAGLLATLKEAFGDLRLKDLAKRVLIPTFCLKDGQTGNWQPRFFCNDFCDSDGNESCVDVGMRTSAAPVYFPSYQNYWDGGIYANNPSMCALAHALEIQNQDVVMLSIGTGQSKGHIDGENLNWGLIQCGKPLASGIFYDLTAIPDSQCQQILKDKYFRLEPDVTTEDFGLDSADKISEMIEFTNQQSILEASGWVEKNWI